MMVQSTRLGQLVCRVQSGVEAGANRPLVGGVLGWFVYLCSLLAGWLLGVE